MYTAPYYLGNHPRYWHGVKMPHQYRHQNPAPKLSRVTAPACLQFYICHAVLVEVALSWHKGAASVRANPSLAVVTSGASADYWQRMVLLVVVV